MSTETIVLLINAVVMAVTAYAAWQTGRQVKLTREATKAQATVKIGDEWRAPELYEAVLYIHRLREEWKEKWRSQDPKRDFDIVAREQAKAWVKDHIPASRDDKVDEQLHSQWAMRRRVSQYLEKAHLVQVAGGLTETELFDLIPEMGRLLIVLVPLEIAIADYWKEHEQPLPVAWDHPSHKWEFNELWKQYWEWYGKRGSQRILTPIKSLERPD